MALDANTLAALAFELDDKLKEKLAGLPIIVENTVRLVNY